MVKDILIITAGIFVGMLAYELVGARLVSAVNSALAPKTTTTA